MILALALALTAAAADREFHSADEVLATFKGEPSVLDVQQMALDYSKTDPHYVDSWLAASKDAAWLPQLDVTYKYDDGQGDDYDYPTGDAHLKATGVDVGNAVTAKATWHLDELVMSSERIRVINEAQDIVKLRDKVLEEVTRLYFERRRLQVEMLLNPGDIKAQIKNELRLSELTAQIDAYSGGRFSRSLKK